MHWEISHLFIIAILVLFIIKKLLARWSFIQSYDHLVNIVLFLAVAIYLAIDFWYRELFAGICAILMGLMAYGKYYLDISKNDEDN